MTTNKIEAQALSLLKTFEGAGKTVSRVLVDGRKIELVLTESPRIDDFDRIDMRYDKA